MKKTMQFLFAMTIMLEGQNSFAGTNESSSILDKPVLNAPLMSPVKSPLVLIVTVTDDSYSPIQGATVSAPCTGLGPMLTNAQGIAEFKLAGSCNCEGAIATVTTPKGCDEQTELKCNSTNPVYCPQ